MFYLGEEPVKLLGIHQARLNGGPTGWEWESPSMHPVPRLNPLAAKTCIPAVQFDSSAGLPILIDLVRRRITASHDHHSYCSSCCCRTSREDLYDGECAPGAGVVHEPKNRG